ncbi:CaiB/BaiF CoA transferase family protein [Terrabacter sp. 2RAF25]|uniref:CaiB/BaiF CoA transferase family protein n=1 Tax=Terrabacter sp. 2RAF25 TaxID=3232998 RepID=UPI003F9C3A53
MTTTESTMESQIPTGTTAGSLVGLRVVELGTSVAGPTTGQILGDLGAEVIKVERVGVGDDTRGWAPPYWGSEPMAFLGLNRNKKSLALDFKDGRGVQVLERLLAGADVLVQNLRPGALAKAGFDAERLRELNPRLVYCEMSGFGSVGPRASEPAYDPLLQAYSGIVSMLDTGDGPPMRVPLSILDKGTGMWAVIGILDALRRRDMTGEGSHVEVSLLQTAVSWVDQKVMGARAGNPAPRNLGSGHPGVVPYGAFPVADGHVFISAGNQTLWTRLVEALGARELLERPGFASNPERAERRAEVNEAVSAATRAFASDELLERLAAAGVPSAPVRPVHEVADDPQVRAVGLVTPLPHPNVPGLEVVHLPVTFDGAYLPHQCPPPELGQHSHEVLHSLGFSADEVELMLADGVVGSTATTVGTPA